jgi:hypothetical protein
MGQLLYVLPLGHKLKYGATRTGRPYCGQVEHDAYAMLVPGDVFLATVFGKELRTEAELGNHD